MELSLWVYLLAASALSFAALFSVDWFCSPKRAGQIRRDREAAFDRAREQARTNRQADVRK